MEFNTVLIKAACQLPLAEGGVRRAEEGGRSMGRDCGI